MDGNASSDNKIQDNIATSVYKLSKIMRKEILVKN